MEKLFEQFAKSASNTTLTTAEKQRGREALVAFMEQSVRNTEVTRLIEQRPSFINLILRPMPIALILLLLVGGSVSYAAEQSLPNQSLYPVKVGVNEEVRAWFAVSSVAKAHWDATLAERRLTEAEKLAAKGELTTDTRVKLNDQFSAQIEKVKARIAAFEAREEAQAAVTVSSALEASLRAHQQILAKLQARQEQAETQAEIAPVKARVDSSLQTIIKGRSQAEANVSAEAQADVQTAAEAKMKAAENKIAEVEKFIAMKTARAGAFATAEAEASLNVARTTLAEGKTKLSAQAYGDAFALFQKAHSLAQAAKLVVERGVELKLDVTTDTDAEVESEQNSNRDEAKTEVETETQSEVDTDAVRLRVKTNSGLQLGL